MGDVAGTPKCRLRYLLSIGWDALPAPPRQCFASSAFTRLGRHRMPGSPRRRRPLSSCILRKRDPFSQGRRNLSKAKDDTKTTANANKSWEFAPIFLPAWRRAEPSPERNLSGRLGSQSARGRAFKVVLLRLTWRGRLGRALGGGGLLPPSLETVAKLLAMLAPPGSVEFQRLSSCGREWSAGSSSYPH